MGGMGAAPMMPGGGPDPAKVYKAEQERTFLGNIMKQSESY